MPLQRVLIRGVLEIKTKIQQKHSKATCDPTFSALTSICLCPKNERQTNKMNKTAVSKPTSLWPILLPTASVTKAALFHLRFHAFSLFRYHAWVIRRGLDKKSKKSSLLKDYGLNVRIQVWFHKGSAPLSNSRPIISLQQKRLRGRPSTETPFCGQWIFRLSKRRTKYPF